MSSEVETDFTSLLERGNFITRFGAGDTKNPCIARLHTLLTELSVEASFVDQTNWLEDMAAWLFQRGGTPNRSREEPEATTRLKLLLQVLIEIPECKSTLRAVFARVLKELDALKLFTDTGLPTQHGIFGEAYERVVRSLMPEPPVEKDAARLLYRLFPDAKAAAWLDALPPEVLQQAIASFDLIHSGATDPIVRSLRDSCILIAARIGSTGIEDEIRARLGGTLTESPFLKLPQAIRELLAPAEIDSAKNVACRELLASCRKQYAQVISTLHTTGISLRLVYRLDYLRYLLDRLYMLLSLVAPVSGQTVQGQGLRFFQLLVRGGIRDRSVYEVFAGNSRLLARRIIDRAGTTGEHYITRTRDEWHEMVGTASGGGAVTAVAVLTKFFIGWAKLPVLWDGLAIGLNYALAFMTMQLCGFTLATKQPSITAATLAAAIKENEDNADLSQLVDQVVRTVRSQLAAAIGNVGFVIPVAAVIDLAIYFLTGSHVLEAPQANRVIEAHHPLTSMTWVYAAMTGGYLWFASVAGGAIENGFVVSKMRDSIATQRHLRRLIGTAKAQTVAKYFQSHIAGLSVGVMLGLQLGLVPMALSLVGIHVEVRHLTFVTGQLVYAGMQRGTQGVVQSDFLWALTSIVEVGLINFAVSFALALSVAFRAKMVRSSEQVKLLFAVFQRFKATPMEFVIAPKSAVGLQGTPSAH